MKKIITIFMLLFVTTFSYGQYYHRYYDYVSWRSIEMRAQLKYNFLHPRVPPPPLECEVVNNHSEYWEKFFDNRNDIDTISMEETVGYNSTIVEITESGERIFYVVKYSVKEQRYGDFKFDNFKRVDIKIDGDLESYGYHNFNGSDEKTKVLLTKQTSSFLIKTKNAKYTLIKDLMKERKKGR